MEIVVQDLNPIRAQIRMLIEHIPEEKRNESKRERERGRVGLNFHHLNCLYKVQYNQIVAFRSEKSMY